MNRHDLEVSAATLDYRNKRKLGIPYDNAKLAASIDLAKRLLIPLSFARAKLDYALSKRKHSLTGVI